jgi:tetratricopeptide (TPR) repeat protein
MTNLIEYEYDVFLSHNYADAVWTEQLAARLEREVWKGKPLKVFYSERDIRPGQSIPQRMQDALTRSRKVALILSPEALKSRWVELEYLATLYSDVSKRQEHLFPLMRRECEPPYLVAPLRYIDFRNDEYFERSYRELLAVICDEPLPQLSERPSAIASLPSPLIPNRPVVGFVARLDRNGRNIVERLKEELAPHQNQIVALWGGGGIGKTTLASEAARAMAEDFAQRVVWVSADQRSNLPFTTFLDEIAAQLGDEDLRRLALEQKIESVRTLINVAPTLIVLDNFETITPEDQLQCMEFLAQRARCTALITTRQRVERAVIIPIASMSAEEADDFLQRLINQTQDPDIYVELNRNRLIQTAEANPLIIQWIVGQIDLANDPEKVLDDLSHGEGDAAHRVFDRSFNLPQLKDGGRAVLLALSLFTPDAGRPAIAKVSGFNFNKETDKKRFKKAQETLASLWLIKKTDVGHRLAVTGLTRELTKARLSADQRNKTFTQRFVAHFLHYALSHKKPTLENFNALEIEKDNTFSAMDMAFQMREWNSVINIHIALEDFLDVRGHWDEAIQRGEQAIIAAQQKADATTVVGLTGNTALIRMLRGEYDKARNAHEQAAAYFKNIDDETNMAAALCSLATIARLQGDLVKARLHITESLQIAEKLGQQIIIGAALNQLGFISFDEGDLEVAQRFFNESLAIDNSIGNYARVADNLIGLASIAKVKGDFAEARRLCEESLLIQRNLGDQSGIAQTLHELGVIAEKEGNLFESARFYSESVNILVKLKSAHVEIARRNLERVEGKSS